MPDLLGTGLILYAVFMIIFLVYITSCSTPEERDEGTDLNKLWQQLRDQTLEISLLVSKACPENVEAHRLVLVAAACLIYPRNNGRTITTSKMIADRYREGLTALAEAKRFCNVNDRVSDAGSTAIASAEESATANAPSPAVVEPIV